jgi:phosphate transport system substrate-binding protein
METLVMKGMDMPDWPDAIIMSMMGVYNAIRSDVNGICYSIHYYKEQIIRDAEFVKSIAVNGIYPDKNTIKIKSYPYSAEVFAVIRSDLDIESMAYKLYELLQTEAGDKVIVESGYIPD